MAAHPRDAAGGRGVQRRGALDLERPHGAEALLRREERGLEYPVACKQGVRVRLLEAPVAVVRLSSLLSHREQLRVHLRRQGGRGGRA